MGQLHIRPTARDIATAYSRHFTADIWKTEFSQCELSDVCCTLAQCPWQPVGWLDVKLSMLGA